MDENQQKKDVDDIKNIKQGTEAWRLSRVGVITASRTTDVMAKIKTGEAAGRKNYRAQLVAERLTGTPTEFFCSTAMQHGTDTEPKARTAYEFIYDVEVVEFGLVKHKTIPMFGASCDGFVGDDGLIEIKCPNVATHIEYLTTRKIPKKYIDQMQAQMSCTGREWCDFMSFDDRLGYDLQTLVIRVPRNNAYIADMEREIVKFNNEVASTIKQLESLEGLI